MGEDQGSKTVLRIIRECLVIVNKNPRMSIGQSLFFIAAALLYKSTLSMYVRLSTEVMGKLRHRLFWEVQLFRVHAQQKVNQKCRSSKRNKYQNEFWQVHRAKATTAVEVCLNKDRITGTHVQLGTERE